MAPAAEVSSPVRARGARTGEGPLGPVGRLHPPPPPDIRGDYRQGMAIVLR